MGKKQLTLDGATSQENEGKEAYAQFRYERYEVISAWIKEMRLGNTKRALYWLRIMMQSGETLYYIARRLYMFAFEDAYSPEAAIYAHSLFEAQKMFGELDHNPVLRGTVYMCKSKKFWEDKAGADEDILWYQIKDEVDAVQKGTLPKLPIPSYAIDKHTLRGKRMLQRGQEIDDRYSGTKEGRMNMIREFNEQRKLGGGEYGERKESRKDGQRNIEAGTIEAQGEDKGASQATEGERPEKA